MSIEVGRSIMRYIDEQAEAIIASGGTIEAVEMGWEQFHALKLYGEMVQEANEAPFLRRVPNAHPDVRVTVVSGSSVRVIERRTPGGRGEGWR